MRWKNLLTVWMAVQTFICAFGEYCLCVVAAYPQAPYTITP